MTQRPSPNRVPTAGPPPGIPDYAAAWLNDHYSELEGERLIAKAIERLFSGRIATVSAFGTESAVLLALIARVDRTLPVIFLDTDKHFPETLAYRDQLATNLGLTDLRIVTPNAEQIHAADRDGSLWSRDPDYCCHLRKVLPLEEALRGFDAWFSGRKRFHGDARQSVRRFEALDGRIQVNPLADWSAEAIEQAFVTLDLPRHPLAFEGYRSIGCATCTRPAGACAGARSGRWAGSDKTECGIHLRRL